MIFKVANSFIYILVLTCLFLIISCAKDVFWNHDAGEMNITKNGLVWAAGASTSIHKDFDDIYDISFTNTGEDLDPPYGTIYVSGIPYQEGILHFPENSIPKKDLSSFYTHDILHESTALGTYSLWLDYPDLHFEITHLSKNEREVEGFLNMAFVVDNPAILEHTTETDTIYFVGNFSLKIPRKR